MYQSIAEATLSTLPTLLLSKPQTTHQPKGRLPLSLHHWSANYMIRGDSCVYCAGYRPITVSVSRVPFRTDVFLPWCIAPLTVRPTLKLLERDGASGAHWTESARNAAGIFMAPHVLARKTYRMTPRGRRTVYTATAELTRDQRRPK